MRKPPPLFGVHLLLRGGVPPAKKVAHKGGPVAHKVYTLKPQSSLKPTCSFSTNAA